MVLRYAFRASDDDFFGWLNVIIPTSSRKDAFATNSAIQCTGSSKTSYELATIRIYPSDPAWPSIYETNSISTRLRLSRPQFGDSLRENHWKCLMVQLRKILANALEELVV